MLVMSFLRILALTSVTAAKKESVAKCAGPLQCGVERPDGANTMIKTIQYLAEADTSRVLCGASLQSSPNGTLAPPSTGCTSSPPAPRSLPTVVLTKDVLSPPVASLLPLIQFLRFVLADICRQLDDGAKLFAYLDDWYLWIKPQCLTDALVLISAATR